MIHRLIIDKKYLALLSKLSQEDLDSIRKKNVEISIKDVLKGKKIPTKFERHYNERTRVINDIYFRARKEKDFSSFAPLLEEMI
jgi:Zn-dependent M32 family carboxypeptidase